MTLVTNREEKKYGAITFWEAEEFALAAAPILNSFMQEHAGRYIKEPPSIQRFEVYKPKE